MKVAGVTFKKNGQTNFCLNPNNIEIKKNVNVIVKTEKGLLYGKVINEDIEIKDEEVIGEIIRIATKEDYLQNLKNINDARKALLVCREKAKERNLDMRVIDSFYNFDREQLNFYFLADTRIDFRELVKDLAAIYRTRIELRQIGVRDKAKEIGGCGMCGRELCCSKFLRELDSVTINMAKNQNISLNPNKINGVCGRLLCCLKYENECYSECRKGLPKEGKIIQTEKGEGKVVSIDILKRTYKVEISDQGIFEFVASVEDGNC